MRIQIPPCISENPQDLFLFARRGDEVVRLRFIGPFQIQAADRCDLLVVSQDDDGYERMEDP